MFRGKRAIYTARFLVLGGAWLLPAAQTSCAPAWSVVPPPAPPKGAVVACRTPKRAEALSGFLADGSRLVIWTRDKKLVVCDAATGRRTFETSVADVVGPAAFHPNGTVVLTGSQAAEMWDLSGAKPRRVLNWRKQRYPGRCKLSPDGRVLAMGDYRIALWDTRTGRRVGELEPPPGRRVSPIGSIHFTPDGRLLAAHVRADVPKVILWRLADGKRLHAVAMDVPKSYQVVILGLSPNGRVAVVREMHHLPMPPGWRNRKAPSPFAAAPHPAAGAIRMGASTLLIDTTTGERLLQLSGRVTLAAAGRLLIEWPWGTSEMRIYDTRTARLLRTITAQNRPAVAANVLAAALPSKAGGPKTTDFGFWDLAAGRRIGTVTAEAWYTEPRALSPDGRMLLLDCGHLTVVDRHSGAKLITLAPKRHLDLVWRFAEAKFSPDGRRIAFLIDGQVGVVHLDKPAKTPQVTPPRATAPGTSRSGRRSIKPASRRTRCSSGWYRISCAVPLEVPPGSSWRP